MVRESFGLSLFNDNYRFLYNSMLAKLWFLIFVLSTLEHGRSCIFYLSFCTNNSIFGQENNCICWCVDEICWPFFHWNWEIVLSMKTDCANPPITVRRMY